MDEKDKQKNRLDFSVFPLWDFLGNTFGMEEAFKVFGPYRGANITPKIINKNTIEVSMSDISFDSYEVETFVEAAIEKCITKKEEENNQ